MTKSIRWLILSDILAIALVTYVGFATHGETDLSFLPRMLAMFVPLVLSWLLIAPWFGLFKLEITSSLRQLWRPVLAMFYAAPLAAVLRGLILNAPIIPIFAVVLVSTSALGILVWRWIYFLITRKKTG